MKYATGSSDPMTAEEIARDLALCADSRYTDAGLGNFAREGWPRALAEVLRLQTLLVETEMGVAQEHDGVVQRAGERIRALEAALSWALGRVARAGPYLDRADFLFHCFDCKAEGTSDQDKVNHAPDCPWAKADALLEEAP